MERGNLWQVKRLLDPGEKEKTRSLYREIFPEDSDSFLDFYYKERAKDNIILTVEEQQEIIAMLHMNPYRLKIRDREGQLQECDITYIYAVATRENYRHRGIMRALLTEAFQILREKHVPISFLIPVDEEIYRPFSYRTVCTFHNPLELEKEIRDRILPLQKECDEELGKHYDLFISRNERFWSIVSTERCIATAEDAEGLPENPVVMMKLSDIEKLKELLRLPKEYTEDEIFRWIQSRRILISEDI